MTRTGLLAVAMIAAMGAGLAHPGPPLRSAGSGNGHRPTPPKRNTALQREIAEWNQSVERRKAEKRSR